MAEAGNAEPAPAQARRRGSLSRVLSKIKDAVRKKGSGAGGNGVRQSIAEEPTAFKAVGISSTVPNKTADHPPQPDVPAPAKGEDVPAEPTLPLVADTGPATTDSPAPADATARDLPIVVDSSEAIEVGDADEPVLPMSAIKHSIRSARGKAVFEKYGIQYAEGPKDLPDGSRHIEKAIRIRIHWECHRCKTGFGGSKSCRSCGHMRCRECPRTPTKRVRDLLGGTAAMQEIDKKAASASEEKDVVVVPIAIGSEASPASAADAAANQSIGASSSSKIAAEGTFEEQQPAPGGNVDLPQSQQSPLPSSRADLQLALRLRGEHARCACHECGALFTTTSRYRCLDCGHGRCSLCPSQPLQADGSSRLLSGEIPALERVYRKPRQRIRWSCDHCHAHFYSSRNCPTCGHERCNTCIRSPSRKPPRAEPSTALVASLTERLLPQQTIAAAG